MRKSCRAESQVSAKGSLRFDNIDSTDKTRDIDFE